MKIERSVKFSPVLAKNINSPTRADIVCWIGKVLCSSPKKSQSYGLRTTDLFRSRRRAFYFLPFIKITFLFYIVLQATMFSPERTVYTNEDIESPNEYQGGSYLGRYLEKNDSCIDNTNGQNIRVMMRLNSLEVKDDDDSNLKDRLDNDKSIDDDEKSNDDMEDTAHDDPNHENEKTKLDTQRVILLRMLLILTLVASATIVSLTVHSYISKNETNQFHNKFRNDAEKISEAVSGSLERTLGVLNAISVAFVSHAAQAADMNNDNITWPFVTLPDFALYASKFLPLTDGVYISVQPLVYPSQKVEWEEYASKNDQWVNDTMSIQEVWEGYHGNVTYDWTTNKHIYGTLGDVESNVRYVFLQSNALFHTYASSHINTICIAATCSRNGKAFQ